jgi:DUF2948 family protein
MAADGEPEPLRLRAEDAEDLAVISACLQDALVVVGDFAFDRDEHRFMFVANRFRWEGGLPPAAGEGGFERILCGIAFDEVTGVSYRGFRRVDDGRILSLLAIRSGRGDKGGVVDLEFAAGATVRLEIGGIRCRLKDLGEPYPTRWLPDHDAESRA